MQPVGQRCKTQALFKEFQDHLVLDNSEHRHAARLCYTRPPMFDKSEGRVVLLTGGTGLVGSGLCQRLVAAGWPKIVIPTRSPPKTPHPLDGLPGVTFLVADLAAPNLGMPGVYESLQRSVTEIVHCAADTRFGVALDLIRKSNVGVTRNLVEFAMGCRRLEKFVHVSTAYVAGRSTGHIPEAFNRHGCGFLNTYQQSKYEAEELVLGAMNHIPASIVRFSSIVGESATGKVTRFNYVHQVLRLLPRNVLPVAPGNPDVPIDLIPSEWAAGSLAHLLSPAFVPGQVFHFCAGHENSFTVGEILKETVTQFENHPIGRTWMPIQLPELVSLSEFEAYAEKIRRKDDKLIAALLTALGYFLPHLATAQYFEREQANKVLECCTVPLPHIREYYSKVVAYCLDTRWIGRRKSQEAGSAARSA